MPSAKANEAYKFARPFEDPYRVVKIYEGEGQGAEVRPVDQPTSEAIRTICAVVLTRFLLALDTEAETRTRPSSKEQEGISLGTD